MLLSGRGIYRVLMKLRFCKEQNLVLLHVVRKRAASQLLPGLVQQRGEGFLPQTEGPRV